MPKTPDDARVLETVRGYREALQALTKLYADASRLIVNRYSWLVEGDPQKFIAEMDDLQRGVAMKIFGELAPAGPADSLEHRQIGRVLLNHLWNEPVMGDQLRQAVDWLVTESAGFRWQILVQPFAMLPPLREHWGELVSLISRMANIVAKSDGEIGPAESAKLQQIQTELERIRGLGQDRFQAGSEQERKTIEQVSRGSTMLRDEAGFGGRLPSLDAVDQLAKSLDKLERESLPGSDSPFNMPAPTVTPQPKPNASSVSAQSPVTKGPPPSTPESKLSPEERLAVAMKKLDELIGLKSIKDQVKTLTNFLKLERLRAQEGLPGTKLALHMSFVGNPGTGKTTVARIIAEIFGALGILTKGQLVETDRSGLVAEYAGQTGPKTNAKIDEAMDGVLFIDEAYTLVSSDSQDQYGREAVQTLLKRMEDARDRLVVIVAGYPQEMDAMIRSNPGLSSRIGQTFEFLDYTPGEMARIFGMMAGKAAYELSTDTRRRILHGLTYLHARRDRHFGNGRTVRNAFEASVRKLANRIAALPTVTRDLLMRLEPDDIDIPGVAEPHLKALCAHHMELRVACSHCHADQQTTDAQLMQSIECSACKQTFTPEWGEPIPPAEPVKE